MAQQLTCDLNECQQGEIIQDGTERVDIVLTARRDEVSGQAIAGALFNFHTPCFQENGPVIPAPGLSITIRRVAAIPPPTPPADPAADLPEPAKAPA